MDSSTQNASIESNDENILQIPDKYRYSTRHVYNTLTRRLEAYGPDAVEDTVKIYNHENQKFVSDTLLKFSVHNFIKEFSRYYRNPMGTLKVFDALKRTKKHLFLTTIIARHADTCGRQWLMNYFVELSTSVKQYCERDSLESFTKTLDLQDTTSFQEDLFLIHYHQWDIVRWLLKKNHINADITGQHKVNLLNELTDPDCLFRFDFIWEIPVDVFAGIMHPTTINGEEGRKDSYPLHNIARCQNSNQLYEEILKLNPDVNVKNELRLLPIETYLFETCFPQRLNSSIITKLTPTQGISTKMFLKLVASWLTCQRLHDDTDSALDTILDLLNFRPNEETEYLEIFVNADLSVVGINFMVLSLDHLNIFLEVMAECWWNWNEVNFVFFERGSEQVDQRKMINEYRNKVPTLKEICIRKIRCSVGFLTQENLEQLRLPPTLQKEISLVNLRNLVLRQLSTKRPAPH